MKKTVNNLVDKRRFGHNIRVLREGKKYTQAYIAEKTGISDNYIGKIERGLAIPSFEIVVAIAILLDTTIDYLLYHRGDKTFEFKNIDRILEHKISAMTNNDKQYLSAQIDLFLKCKKND